MAKLNIIDYVKLLKSFVLNYPKVSAAPFWKRSKIEALQLSLLKSRLQDAKKVALYQKLNLPDVNEIQTLSDWSKLPIISKQILLSHAFEDRLNNDYSITDLIETKSSGSTGVALTVYYDKKSYFYYMMAEIRFFMMAFKYKPWHKQAYIYTSEYPYQSFLGFFKRQFIHTLQPIEDIIHHLRLYPPDLLVSYPSHLRAIVDRMTEEDLKQIRPKAVCVNSEMSSSLEREYLSKKLGAVVFDEYSSEELNWIASQCSMHHYHIFDDINYLEVVDDNNNPVEEGIVGNLVGSNLHNRAMPLLRYMQGDRGAIRSSSCSCGRTFKILEKLEGRKNDAFLLPNGNILSPGFLLDLTYTIFLNYDQIAQAFCLIQETPEQWILEVVPGKNWHPRLENEVYNNFIRDLNQPDVNLKLKIVTQVKRTQSGKSNPIISLVSKS